MGYAFVGVTIQLMSWVPLVDKIPTSPGTVSSLVDLCLQATVRSGDRLETLCKRHLQLSPNGTLPESLAILILEALPSSSRTPKNLCALESVSFLSSGEQGDEDGIRYDETYWRPCVERTFPDTAINVPFTTHVHCVATLVSRLSSMERKVLDDATEAEILQNVRQIESFPVSAKLLQITSAGKAITKFCKCVNKESVGMTTELSNDQSSSKFNHDNSGKDTASGNRPTSICGALLRLQRKWKDIITAGTDLSRQPSEPTASNIRTKDVVCTSARKSNKCDESTKSTLEEFQLGLQYEATTTWKKLYYFLDSLRQKEFEKVAGRVRLHSKQAVRTATVMLLPRIASDGARKLTLVPQSLSKNKAGLTKLRPALNGSKRQKIS